MSTFDCKPFRFLLCTKNDSESIPLKSVPSYRNSLDHQNQLVLGKIGFHMYVMRSPTAQAQFYPSARYQRYNMFNGFFYEPTGQETCQQFLQSDHVAMVIDPPFGGRAEVLGQGIRKLWRLAGRGQSSWVVYLTAVWSGMAACVKQDDVSL